MRMPWSRQTPPARARFSASAITASGQVASDGAGGGTTPSSRSQDPRTNEQIWTRYDEVGELHYAANFLAFCFSRVVLQPGFIGDDMQISALLDENGQPKAEVAAMTGGAEMAAMSLALIRALKAPHGGQPRLMQAIGLNISLPADMWLVGQDVKAGDKVVDRSWEVLSTDELRPKADRKIDLLTPQWSRIRFPGAPPEDVPAGSYVLRIWMSHPRFTALADSPVKSVLDVLEELVLLTRGVRATALSRLAGAGVYWIPEEIDFDEDEGAPPDAEGAHPFQRQMIKVMQTPIADKSSPAGFVPFVVSAPGEAIAQIRHDTFQAPDDALSILKRTEAVQRLGQGLPLPVEVITGQGGSNHWSAWQIDESTFKVHVEPLLALVCDALTVGYLRPMLRAAAKLPADAPTPEPIARASVWYDATELVTHPNREQIAQWGYGTAASPNFVVSSSWARRAIGASETDRPDDAEIAERLAWAVALKSQSAAAAGDGPQSDPAQGAPAVEPGAPTAPATPGVDGTMGASSRLVMELAIAGQHAVERSIDRAGSRIRDAARRNPQTASQLNGTAAHDVARSLGVQTVTSLVSINDLFVGEFTAFERLAMTWAVRDHHPHPQAVVAAAAAVVNTAVRHRLFDPTVTVTPASIVAAIESVTPDE